MIGPDDVPEDWVVAHVLRVKLPGGSTIEVETDDGSPVAGWEELRPLLEAALGSARRAEATRLRRRDIRRRRRDQDRRDAA